MHNIETSRHDLETISYNCETILTVKQLQDEFNCIYACIELVSDSACG